METTPTEPKRVRSRFQKKAFLIPTFVTVAAIFSGFLGAISALRGDFEYATKCIAFAILFDGLDGRVARRLNATSEFGREFDSLSDVVAFGVTPALMVYLWGFKAFADDFGVLVAFVYVVCGAARLARFNVTTTAEPKHYFTGLPIPGAAAAVAAVVYFHPQPLESKFAVAFAAFLLLTLGGLMVSQIPFYSVKHLKFTGAHTRLNIFLAALAIALAWYNSRIVLLLGTFLYAFGGPFLLMRKQPVKADPESVQGAKET